MIGHYPGIVTYLTFIGFILLGLTWLYKRQKKVRLIERLPGPSGLPILGNALDVNISPQELFRLTNHFCEFGHMTRLWVMLKPYVLISGAKATEMVLSSPRHVDKIHEYKFLHPWLGTGLLTATGMKWHTRRKLLTPAFHFKILDDFLEVFNKGGKKMVTKLLKKADGTPFNITTDVTLCALDVICETAMGCNINAQDNQESDYVKAVYRMGDIVQKRMCRPWLQSELGFRLFGNAKVNDASLKILHDFSYATIRNRRKAWQDATNSEVTDNGDDSHFGKKKRLAFLDLLLEYSEDGKVLSDEDIREEVDTFMFEGHDTTAAAINWFLYLIGSHPDIQARVQDELDSVFGDSDRPATRSDLQDLKYLENCIKETLRLFPSVPYLGRQLKEDLVVDDMVVPAGVGVIIVVYRLHRDPEQFPDPEVFDPDRFLPENCKNRHPYAYVPFSAGPRNCIGQKFAMMELKVLMSSILRKFHVRSTTKREDLKIVGQLILRPDEGVIVKLLPRTHVNNFTTSIESALHANNNNNIDKVNLEFVDHIIEQPKELTV